MSSFLKATNSKKLVNLNSTMPPKEDSAPPPVVPGTPTRSNSSGMPKDTALGSPGPEEKLGFKKSIMGDVFGSINDSKASMLGMLYRSRITGGKNTRTNNIQNFDDADDASVTSHISANVDLADEESDESDIDEEADITINPKLRLAMTIKNWTLRPENDAMIMAEGAVHALVALTSIDDRYIKLNCATALFNLASREANRQEFLNIGGAVGISTICKNVRNW